MVNTSINDTGKTSWHGSNAVPWFVVIVLLTIITGYRLTLIDRGHFAWGDERYHLPAEDLVDSLMVGNVTAAVEQLFESRGPVPAARPGYVLIATVHVMAERTWSYATGISSESLQAFDAASVVNVGVSLGISICLFLLAYHWSNRNWLAGAMALLSYSLLVNANMWIRHLVAYDEALLCFLSALVILTLTAEPKREPGYETSGRTHNWHAYGAGLLTGMGFACYPGYYAFVLINSIVALSIYRRSIASSLFLAGGATIAIFFETLAQAVGASYLHNLTTLGSTITMGHTPETWIFLPKYLVAVEGLVGVGLLLFSGVIVVSWLSGKVLRPPAVAMVAFSAAVGGYCMHAFMGSVLGKMVFYGRLIAMYIPMLVLFVTVVGAQHRIRAVRVAGASCLCVVSLVSFVTFATTYAGTPYPADLFFQASRNAGVNTDWPAHVLWDVPDARTPLPEPQLDHRFLMVTETRSNGADVYVHLDDHQAIQHEDAPFIGVNLKWMFEIKMKDAPVALPEGYSILAEAVHPSANAWVAFEGYKPWERRRLLERRYKMRLLAREDTVSAHPNQRHASHSNILDP
ncbi:MAG: hypothetical protein ACPGXK_05000 [Phycisphaerae bacterium]